MPVVSFSLASINYRFFCDNFAEICIWPFNISYRNKKNALCARNNFTVKFAKKSRNFTWIMFKMHVCSNWIRMLSLYPLRRFFGIISVDDKFVLGNSQDRRDEDEKNVQICTTLYSTQVGILLVLFCAVNSNYLAASWKNAKITIKSEHFYHLLFLSDECFHWKK